MNRLVRAVCFLAGSVLLMWTESKQHGDSPTWHPQEARHRKIEKRYWFGTLALTAALAILAGASAFFAYQAAQAAYLNFIATTRAWLTIAQPFESLTLDWRDEYALFGVVAAALNKGSSPALNVFLATSVGTPQNISAGANPVERFCATPGSGAVLLPGEQRGTSIAMPFTPPMSDPEQQPIPPSMMRAVRGAPYEVVEMAVCVTYKIVSDQKWHHTLQYFYLGKPQRDQAKGLYPDPIIFGENLSDGQMIADFDDTKGFAD